jgi:hypothetical protein
MVLGMGNRFVILKHTLQGQTHFDLMLEVAGQEKLRTLQLARWPLAMGESCAVKQIGDHRRAYLEYEGEVSGGRGVVVRVAAGAWRDDDGVISLGAVRLRLQGEQLARNE